MATGPLFVPNPRFEPELLASHDVRTMLETLRDPLEDGARDRARVRTGHLRDSIHYDVDLDDGQFAGRLNDDDFKAGWYEFGSARSPADAFLRNTVEEVVGPVGGSAG